jgi:CheY-like chemotaxis protein
MNLMVNARDAMPDGGKITLRARRMESPEGDFVCLAIEDEGEGMDQKTLARAAEPFFTTKGVGRGTGLGLSMVQGMVEQCGGRLVLESEPGRGTTAEIWLRVADDAVQDDAAPPAEIAVASKPLRILVVDDDAIILLNTATVLADLGHTVFEAHGGKEALEILSRETVDLLITDFAMPNMTGAELIETVCQRHPGLRVILASGYADLPEGATIDAPRLSKPFTEADLVAAIAALDSAG